MKTKKIIPFAFLGLLLLIVIFIIGVKYGRQVAEVDKTIKFLISITPTKAITPSPQPSISYLSYSNEDCGVEFLYPSDLSITYESSTGGQLKNKNKDTIEFGCRLNAPLIKNMPNTATTSVMIQDKEITASKSGDIYIFGIKVKNDTIQFAVSSRLKALMEKTLTITK